MIAQVAKTLKDEQAAGAAAHLFVFQGPGGGMWNEHRIQAGFQRRVDITARAVANHPAARFHHVVPVYKCAVRLRIFFRHDFNRVEVNLQARAFHLGRLFRRLALREKNQAMSLGEISQRFDYAIQDAGRRALKLTNTKMNSFDGRAFGAMPREFHVRVFQRTAEAAHAVTVLANIAALGFVQDVARVIPRIAEGLQQRQEFFNGLLEEDIIFPKRVVGIDQDRFSWHDSDPPQSPGMRRPVLSVSTWSRSLPRLSRQSPHIRSERMDAARSVTSFPERWRRFFPEFRAQPFASRRISTNSSETRDSFRGRRPR